MPPRGPLPGSAQPRTREPAGPGRAGASWRRLPGSSRVADGTRSSTGSSQIGNDPGWWPRHTHRAWPLVPRHSPRGVMQRELVERARTGDHDAFANLAAAAISRLDSAAWLILRDPEQAKDAVQNTLVRAWRDLPTLRDPDRFDAWLHRLVVRACIDEAR